MQDSTRKKGVQASTVVIAVTSFLLLPVIWIAIKYLCHINDRLLPSPVQVMQACTDIEPNLAIHVVYTACRLVLGFVAGVIAGIAIGIAANRSKLLSKFLTPALDSMRSVPAIAIIPFFLMWFGFSECGRILLVVTGIAFNIAIATYQVLADVPEKYRILFKGFGIQSSSLMCKYTIPRIMETLLPTVRFSLSTAMGVVIASELLGSQVGLGYLMQTARSTFSMHVIFLCTILLGVLNACLDGAVTRLWTRSVYWR